MIPIRLQIRGFLSYQNPAELDFTGFDLACISGSNGAGKSSILDAITWALFGQARKTDDSIINTRAGDHTAEVIFDFAYEGAIYRIQRSKLRDKPNRLDFFIQADEVDDSSSPENHKIWKGLTEKSIKETEKRIRDILRLDYETFINASFFLQGKADQFAQQKPGDRKRILGSILGLEIWETYKDSATKQRKAAEDEVAGIDGSLHEIEAELAEGPARQAKLDELQKSLAESAQQRSHQEETFNNLQKLANTAVEQRKVVDLFKRQLDDGNAKLKQTITAIEERQKEQQSYQAKIEQAAEIETAYAAWQQARQALAESDALAANFRQEQAKRQAPLIEIESERSRLQQEEKSLAEQELSVAHDAALLPFLAEQLAEVNAELQATEALLQTRPVLEEQIRQHLQAQSDARVENPRLKADMDELKARINELNNSSACPLCGQDLTPEHREHLIFDLNEQGKKMGDRCRQNLALLHDFETVQNDLIHQLNQIKTAEETRHQALRQLDKFKDQQSQIEQSNAEWETNGKPRLQVIREQLAHETFALEAHRTLAAIDAALKQIGYDPQAHEALRKEEQAGRQTEAAMRELDAARATLAPLQRELERLLAQKSSQQNDQKHLQSEYDHSLAIWQATTDSLPDLDQVEDELNRLRERENILRSEVGAAQQRVDVLVNRKAEKKKLTQAREEKTIRIGRLKILERAFSKDGIPALLIEQALPEIQEQANKILGQLSDGSMSVQFSTQREFKDKNRDDKKETLDIQISDRLGTYRDYELFSGGEAFRINFAIRLALSRVLAQRAGARLQTLVIDEGFGSQDAEGRQRLIEAINLVAHDFSKILIITHLDELKEAFPTHIEVEKTDQGSTIQVI